MKNRKTARTLSGRLLREDREELMALATANCDSRLQGNSPLALFAGQVCRVNMVRLFHAELHRLCASLHGFDHELEAVLVFDVRTIVDWRDRIWDTIDRFWAATERQYHIAKNWSMFAREAAEIKQHLSELRQEFQNIIQNGIQTNPQLARQYMALTRCLSFAVIEGTKSPVGNECLNDALAAESLQAVRQAVTDFRSEVICAQTNIEHSLNQVFSLLQKAQTELFMTIRRTSRRVSIR